MQGCQAWLFKEGPTNPAGFIGFWAFWGLNLAFSESCFQIYMFKIFVS